MATKKIEVDLDGAKKVVEVPEPLKRKCKITQVLPVGVLQLLASAPHNETVRNVLLAHLKQSVPEELKTYTDIQDWIEFNIDPPNVLIAKIKTAPGRADELVQVLVVADEREHGSCCYHRDLTGRGTVGISREDILEAAAESDEWEEFVNNIRGRWNDSDVRDRINLEPLASSTSYDSHESDESDGIEVIIQEEGENALKQMLQTLDPEGYARLFE